MRQVIVRRLIILSFVCILLLSIASQARVAAKDVYTFRYGGSDAIGTLLDRTNRKMIELAEKKSNGRLKFEFFPADQLGGDIAQIEQMMANSIQFYGDVLEWYANWVKDFAIFGWGFAFRDSKHMEKFFQSQVYRDMVEKLRKEYGIRILAAAPTVPRVLLSKKPISGLDDLKNIKMRIPEIEAYLRVWQALGTRPSRVTWAEVYLALKTGVVEACEGPISAAYGAKFHEAAPYVYRTDHIISTVHITVNDQAYRSLPPDLQKVLDEAAKEAVAWAKQESDREVAEVVKKMEAEGAKVLPIDTAPFQERLRAAAEKAEEDGLWSKGLYQKVQAIK